MRWLDRIHSGSGAARLDAFLNQYGDEHSMAEAARLVQALSEDQSKWTGKPLAAAMGAARKRRLRRRKTAKAMISLPPLNPDPAMPKMQIED